MRIIPLCPNCKKSYYRVDGSDVTAMYYTPVYKDGVLISRDPNIITNHCTCLACGTKFSFTKSKRESGVAID